MFLSPYQQRIWPTLVAHRVDVAGVERDEIGHDALGSVQPRQGDVHALVVRNATVTHNTVCRGNCCIEFSIQNRNVSC